MTWPRVPLKRLASIRVSNVDKLSTEGDYPVRLCNYTDVYYRSEINPDQEFMQATATADQLAAFRLRSGDVVITKDSETPEDIGVPSYVRSGAPDLVCGYHLAVIRPDGGRLLGRYLYWAMASALAREQLSKTSTGVTRFGLRSDAIGNTDLLCPPRAHQQAIADFLDAETARIDSLIAKKRQVLGLLDEWEQAAMLSVLGDWRRAPTSSLRQFGTAVVTGPFGTQLSANEYVSGGVPLVNPVHIRRGRIVPEEVVSVTETTAARLSRHRLSEGDLVLGRKGDVGRAALVGPENDGWICGSDAIAVRPRRDRLHPRYLAFVLRVDYYRQQLASRSTGAMVANVNEHALLNFQLPLLPLSAQATAIKAVSAIHQQHDGVTDRLTGQISLLQEHRQALITAAVTGEIAVGGTKRDRQAEHVAV